jgi:hypothetical protein
LPRPHGRCLYPIRTCASGHGVRWSPEFDLHDFS